jgi:hypothetical protein
MKFKALQHHFLLRVLILYKFIMKCAKLMLHSIIFLRLGKSNDVTFFRKKFNELLVIRYLILGVTVPLQLLVTAVKTIKKTLLVTSKVTSYVTL